MIEQQQQAIRPCPNILVQELDGEMVMLNLDTEYYFSLNGVASRMWAVLTTAATIDEAVSRLLAEYEVDEATLRDDIAEFIQALQESEIIEA